MTLVQLPGGAWLNSAGCFASRTTTLTSFGTTLVIDATGEKISMCGRFTHASRTTKSIRKIHFRAGAIVSAGGSAIDISLQNLSNTTGPPLVPDETQDEKVSSVLLSTLTASGWNTTANLSADRSVAFGELFAVVFEYDAAGRLGADSLTLSSFNRVLGLFESPGSQLKTGGTWAVPSSDLPNVIFECSDGSFGTFDESLPAKTISSVGYKSDSGSDEYALSFIVPVELAVDAVSLPITVAANTSDFDVVLYNNTTPLVTVSFDANRIQATGTAELFVPFGSDITLSPGNTYYLAVKPTQATSTITVYYFEVNAVGHFDPITGGQNWQMASRVDGGAWSNYGSNLRRMRASIRISQIGYPNAFCVENQQLILPTQMTGY